MIALLAAHTGAHAAAHAAPVAVLPQIFRRAIAAVRRKLAVPGAVAERDARVPADATPGAATTLLTPPDGTPVLGDRMLSQVRAEHDETAAARRRWDAERMNPGVPCRPLPGVRPSAAMTTSEFAALDAKVDELRRPVNGRSLGTLPRRKPAATLNRAPWETGAFTVPADVTLVPVYGQAPVARVLEAERLAGVMRP